MAMNRQTQSYQWSNGCRQEPSEQIVGHPGTGDVSGLRHVLGKMVLQYSQSLLPDSSSFSKGWPSSSVTALRESTGFLVRQARCPLLHLAKAVSFSVCVQGRFVISASRSARFSRVRFAMVWLSLWKSTHSEEIGSKQFSRGFHASQHRMSVPRCLFL